MPPCPRDRSTPARRLLDVRLTAVTKTSAAMTAPVELERPETGMDLRPDRPWITLVWNDPINLMSYVSYVFRTYFGYDQAEADRLMLTVHNEGRAVVSNGTREEMERDVAAMHGYGLWATLQQDD
jgi:ATP-dependent Clp protease adaptor protein ClpS